MVDIRPRSSWDPRYQDGDLTLAGLALEVFAHHTVTTQLSPTATVAAEAAEMRKVETIGQSRFGTGISYNVIVFPSGRAYQGVSWNRRGTHTGGMNSTVRSICFAGNYETNEPTAAQLATAAAIYHEGKGKWWKATAPLRGHRDVKETACPGRNVYDQLPAIRAGKITTPEMEEGFLMALSDEQQVEALRTLRAIKARVDEQAPVLWNVRQIKAKVDLQAAVIETLVASAGLDAAAVTAAIEKALADVTLTLTATKEG